MPPFSKEDFTQENAQRLRIIVMKLIGKHPMSSFHTLPETQKRKFNRTMNDYIRDRLGENWEEVLHEDFNAVVLEDILNEDFDPSKQFVPELNSKTELILNEEQNEYFEKNPEELGKIKGMGYNTETEKINICS